MTTGRTETAAVARFRALVARRLGLSFAETDGELLHAVLRRRAARHRTTEWEYVDRLLAGAPADELAALAEELTITETYFFRHGEQIEALTRVALPARVRARAAERRLRLLSVGCASGEEPYTLAIVATEAIPGPGWEISVLGVDANPAMLRKAAAAEYSAWALRVTPDPTRRRWFQPHGRGFRLDDRIRATVRFLRHNLSEDHPALWRPGEYDVIFCRNVLMYLTSETARELVARMTTAMAPGGYLFLGHTDTLGARPPGLRVHDRHDAFFYERTPEVGPTDGHPGSPAGPRAGAAVAAPPARAPTSPPAGPAEPTRIPGPPRPARPAPAGAALSAAVPVPHPPAPWAAAPDIGGPAPHSAPWRLAVRLLREERFREALEVLDAVPAPAFDDTALQVLRAVLLAQDGRLRRAAATCHELLAVEALNADVHHLLAICQEDDDPVSATEHHRVAAYLDPEFALPHLKLGALALRRGDRRAARRELERAIELLPAERDDRIVFFGGGFGRHALLALCHTQLKVCEESR